MNQYIAKYCLVLADLFPVDCPPFTKTQEYRFRAPTDSDAKEKAKLHLDSLKKLGLNQVISKKFKSLARLEDISIS